MSESNAAGKASRRRAGSRLFWAALFILAVTASAWLARTVLMAARPDVAQATSNALIIHVAAALRAPMEAIAADYTRETGQAVDIRLGPSQTLLANIELSRQGDLYIPADDTYVALAQDKNLAMEVLPIGKQTIRIVTQKGNPKQIVTLDDLFRDDVRLAQANPDSAAAGRLVRARLEELGRWDALAKRTAVYKPTVIEVANDVKINAADASFGWDTMRVLYPDLEFVTIPPLDNLSANISATVLSTSTNATAALRFARYVTASDRGLPRFQQAGFEIIAGDKWVEVPEIEVLAGSMLRPAIEQTITAFEAREGVRVTRVYNGCGILVAQMKAGQHPDAYISCDVAFMKQVDDLFEPATTLSRNRLVIAVQKGNPHKITRLRDLAREGLRVGVGHEQQCALGVVTKQTFLEGGVYGDVSRNVVVQVPAGDMLINQMRTGSLDAAVVYVSNMKLAGGELDSVEVTGLPCSIVDQPAAIGRGSEHPQLSRRLLDRLLAAESETLFRDWGFDWVGGAPAEP